MGTPKTKQCTACGCEKPASLEYFHKCRGGLTAQCRECKNAYLREYRNTDSYRAKHAAAERKRRAERPEEYRESSRRYRKVHGPAIKSRPEYVKATIEYLMRSLKPSDY